MFSLYKALKIFILSLFLLLNESGLVFWLVDLIPAIPSSNISEFNSSFSNVWLNLILFNVFISIPLTFKFFVSKVSSIE